MNALAASLAEHRGDHPLRVAVDGITASGKTTFATELSTALAHRDLPVIRILMDDFHHLREHRYRQGRGSARGYYDDAFDFDSLFRCVLEPLGPQGDRRFRRRIIDLGSDTVVDESEEVAAPDGILVVDGSFMQRHHRDDWDVVIFLDTSFEEALRRGVGRDGEAMGGRDAAADRYAQRYHAACRMYVDEIDPARRADIVVDNEDVTNPVVRST